MTISIDTNVFVYAVDNREPVKQQAALQVVRELGVRRVPVALQVIGELQNALRRRLKQPVHVASQQARNIFVAFDSFAYGEAEVDSALAQSAAGRMSYWDALLLASCASAGVETFLTEDLQDGQTFNGVEVVNPFSAAGLSDRARTALGL